MSDTNTAPAAEEGITIDLNDLQGYLQLIDIAAQRGAYRGDELSTVGARRDKLAAFLKEVAEKAEAAAKAAEGEAEVPADEAPAEAAKPKAAKRAKKA